MRPAPFWRVRPAGVGGAGARPALRPRPAARPAAVGRLTGGAGAATGVTRTVAWAWAVATRPAWLTAVAVTVSVWEPSLARKSPLKAQVKVWPGCRTAPTPQLPLPLRSPNTLSTSEVIRTGSPEVLVTPTVKLKVPPGAGREAG